ncbi:hypothetical protein BDY24DRAFT_389458 [Mrakia frigida]|uniref:Aim29p n=1 Tax=Mrakia frigida TaxID=29902 RepID=UPI003FCBEFE2
MSDSTSTPTPISTTDEPILRAPIAKSSVYSPFVPRPPSPTQHPVTSSLNSPEHATITVRVIKSFPYRTMKALVLRNVDLQAPNGVEELIERCRKEILTAPGFKPFRTYIDHLNTLKLYTKAHGSKTMNLIINLTNDETEILPISSSSLSSYGIENETELSLFNREGYEEFKLDPTTKWDP